VPLALAEEELVVIHLAQVQGPRILAVAAEVALIQGTKQVPMAAQE
jgi:hypothetical protein